MWDKRAAEGTSASNGEPAERAAEYQVPDKEQQQQRGRSRSGEGPGGGGGGDELYDEESGGVGGGGGEGGGGGRGGVRASRTLSPVAEEVRAVQIDDSQNCATTCVAAVACSLHLLPLLSSWIKKSCLFKRQNIIIMFFGKFPRPFLTV